MTEIWDSLVVGPLIAGLVGLHGLLGSYGLAIIVLTLAIKLITFPLNLMQIRSAKSMRDVQPHVDDLKRRYGKDKEKLTQETMKLYKEHGVNPASGCLPLVVQMPVWFGLYGALLHLAQTAEGFQQGFLWLPSLANPDPFYILVLLTVATQFVVQKMMTMPSSDPQQQMMNKVMLFMPLTFGFVATSVPSGLVLYWVTTNVFTFFQQLFTAGWGGLMPNASAPAVAPALPSSNPGRANGEGSRTSSAPKVPKAARHKKRAGAKPTGEEKKANGKR